MPSVDWFVRTDGLNNTATETFPGEEFSALARCLPHFTQLPAVLNRPDHFLGQQIGAARLYHKPVDPLVDEIWSGSVGNAEFGKPQASASSKTCANPSTMEGKTKRSAS